MISKILNWIREVFLKMIGKPSIKQTFDVDVAISDQMQRALELWTKMYENKAPWLTDTLKSLNLPAAIASELSRLATVELKIQITGSSRADFLAEEFSRVVTDLREVIEYASAKGGLVFKPYVVGKHIFVDYVHADQFYPVKFNGRGEIRSAVFVDQRKISQNNHYTRLEFHDLTSGAYIVKNKAFRGTTSSDLGSSVPLTVVDDWANLQEEATIKNVDFPLFSYFRFPLANNIDTTSKLGVSCYSRATDLIRNADQQWGDLLWEFESGQRALYVDVLAFGKDSDGKPILPHKRLYKTLETGSPEGELYHEWTPNFREQNILNGLDAILKKIEFVCGLAYGTLSDPNSIEKTATEIAASKQRTFSTVVDLQKEVQSSIEDLIRAMDMWATLMKLAPKGTYEISFEFDDSVIVDKAAQFQQDLTLVYQGIMSPLEFRMRNLGESEEVAQAALAKIKRARLFEEDEKENFQ